MSFQGDVGGIGLADLLQSLARGRDGVLSLLGKEGLKSTLGFEGGLVHLLPDPEEDPEIWRHRARQAWVKDPDFRIDSLRMNEIARAARTEMVYRLLDSEGVHFRFAPGNLPEAPTEISLSAAEPGTERKGPRRDAVYVQGTSVEGLLLEYARLKDEAQSANVDWPHFEDSVLVPIFGADVPKDRVRYCNECDGQSSLAETADRLGWPLRQIRLTAIAELQRGAARLSSPDELLVLAQYEIAQGYTDRGTARLRAWLHCAAFGPLSADEAQSFQLEWEAGRLQPVLRALPPALARTFLRRMDAAIGAPLAALDHWAELVRSRREDRIAVVRLVHMQAIASADPNVPAVRDLLAMARSFLEAERRFAAAAVLRIASTRAPESTNVRLEIGVLMLDAGLGREAGPWILDAATQMLEAGDVERALPPLREYVALDPGNREARRLLARARAHSVKRTLVKRNSLVSIAVVLALSVGAVVQYQAQRSFSEKLDAVNARLDDPAEALKILDAQFKGEESARVGELRNTLVEKKKIADAAARTAWTDRYREAQIECTLGDPVLGLRRTLDLPTPPDLGAHAEPLPLVPDLFNSLSARIETQVSDLGTTIEDTPTQTKAEGKVRKLLEDLREPLLAARARPEATDFGRRLDAFGARLEERAETRARDRARKEKKDSLAQQDILIGAARAHENAGDFERSLQLYKQLIESDTTGKLGPLLRREVGIVTEKSAAVATAAELSRQGKQQEAHALLLKVLNKTAAAERAFTWKVESVPTGARAHLSDGAERVTPFTLESSWDETITMTIELAGHEPVTLAVDHPSDQSVMLSRIPERCWKPGGRIEALPVKLGDDHIVCDRNGHVARLSKGSNLVWKQDLHSLGGVGRSPVFLPRDPGHLLLVTEDGDAWIVASSSGELEGPWTHGVPPVQGPRVGENGVRVRFRDGATFEWSTRLNPEVVVSDDAAGAGATTTGESEEPNSGLAVLRRRTSSSTTLASPWTDYQVDVGPQSFSVHADGAKGSVFTVVRGGDWTFMAWEAPNARLPQGRLWISDGLGLRSFTP